MIPEGLDYKRHYAHFETTPIGKLEIERRALVRKIADLKASCHHPEEQLQWLSQGDITLFYCSTCGESFKYDARDRSADFFDMIRRKIAADRVATK